ncbi:MAG TPA: amidohydrolase family protein [Verrucomicrobiae bacterium]|nr:amidohydrolase family protein [Verrucomicrobiae bacterium]
MRRIFNDKVISVRTAGERAISDRHGKSAWHAAEYDADVRCEQVKEAGIDYQFVSAGTVGMFSYIDAEPGAAFTRASNNFIYEKFMKSYPKLFTGAPQLPLQDTREAMKELERCVKELGMLTFLMPTNWNGIDLADPHWWRLYDYARELGVRGVIVHIGSFAGPWIGKDRLAVLGSDGTPGRRIVSQTFEYSANIVNLIFGGLLDAFPELNFAFLEAGAEFAVNLKHRIDENVEQIAYLEDLLKAPVDKYFDRFYFVVDDLLLEENGKRLARVMEELGADRLFFGSDYPHDDGHLDVAARIKDLDSIPAATKQKLLAGNVVEYMGGKLAL